MFFAVLIVLKQLQQWPHSSFPSGGPSSQVPLSNGVSKLILHWLETNRGGFEFTVDQVHSKRHVYGLLGDFDKFIRADCCLNCAEKGECEEAILY